MSADRTVHSPNAPAAVGPYVQAVRCDGWLYCSGQIPIDPSTGAMSEGDIGAQTALVLGNLQAVLEAGGCGPSDVVKCTVYLADLGDFAAMNEVYAGVFGTEAPPARATVEVAALPKGARVEIDCIARIPA
jgi:2-iminobutanoate/2-iminopropanoate deaminase